MAGEGRNPGVGGARIARWLDRALTAVVALVMFAMMALTFIDVLGRYLFNAPVPGGFEIIEFIMPLAIFSALPLITRDDGHITVSVLDGVIRGRARWLQRLCILAGSSAVTAFIAFLMWGQGNELVEGQTESGFLEWPIGPVAYVVSGLSAVTFLILMVMTGRHVAGARRRD